jgi:hypothetical protein
MKSRRSYLRPQRYVASIACHSIHYFQDLGYKVAWHEDVPKVILTHISNLKQGTDIGVEVIQMSDWLTNLGEQVSWELDFIDIDSGPHLCHL